MSEFETFDDKELTVGRLVWESSVSSAHQKFHDALDSDTALGRAQLDHGRLFHLWSGPNNAVPAGHARLGLVPHAQTAVIGGIVKLTVRIPISPLEALPSEQVKAYMKRRAARYEDDVPGDIPTNDIFLEAIKDGGECMRLLMTPDGLKAYSDADDIYAKLEGPVDGQLFAVELNADTAAQQAIALAEWPSDEQFYQMLQRYDVFPQETSGEAPLSA